MLGKYISNLLIEYDCVIIPDFGGFVGIYAPARIHPTQHSFEPPYKKIAFNKNLSTNDGLLANAIASDLSISFNEATLWIEQEVLRIEIRLAKREKVELAGVGTLYNDIENNLQFTADTTINYLLDSFGLSSFQSPAIKRENFTERIEKQFKDRPPIPIPVAKKVSKKTWQLAALIPILLLLIVVPFKLNLVNKLNTSASSFSPFYEHDKPVYIERTQVSTLPNTIFKSSVELALNATDISYIALTDDNSKTIPVKPELMIESTQDEKLIEHASVEPIGGNAKNSNSNTEPLSSRPSNYVKTGSYSLIAGCFKEKENALALITELKAKGFNAGLAGQNSQGLYRVSYHTFADRFSAEAAKEELKSENPDIWLMKN
ncbi:MAG TPA: SPOR domain-containing protein [Bacteroidia bacterium]|nr:SPOR domain-containing protein [Bacteroidia bacterium]HRH09568.1 SPOR domain-containing protein [Bacteroidia bacterium]HRH63074.1 SPOR domain-containing protein [Bacteroidia bacterium]